MQTKNYEGQKNQKNKNQENSKIEPEDFQKPLPLTIEDIKDTSILNATPRDVLQLQVDIINVLEGRVDIETFPSDYQKRIQDYYRFSGAMPGTMGGMIAQAGVKRYGKG